MSNSVTEERVKPQLHQTYNRYGDREEKIEGVIVRMEGETVVIHKLFKIKMADIEVDNQIKSYYVKVR
jgi:hypothetical protein